MSASATRAVPKFKKSELAPRRSDYCVVVFVINENGRLHSQLARMEALADEIDIVIADGGSTDGSTDLDKLREFDVNTLLVKQGPGRLGAQMRMAFAWALDRGYEGVVVVDGNNKDSVEVIPEFVELLRDGYDHIQGSRFIPGGRHENTPFGRYWGVRLLHAPLMRFASGFPYTDTTNGFRAYSRRLLAYKGINVFRDIFVGYELHYYLARYAPKYGFKCMETPVARVYPKKGKTPTKISPVRGNLDVLKRLFAVCLGYYE